MKGYTLEILTALAMLVCVVVVGWVFVCEHCIDTIRNGRMVFTENTEEES